MNQIIKDYLYHLNTIEKQQQKTGVFHFDFPESSVKIEKGKMIFLDNFFLDNKSFYISKHNRFADYPEHTHEFLEMNYMLAGSCTQVINNQEVVLEEGNLLLLDSGSTHQIHPLGEKDILINIIFKNKGMDLDWLTTLNEQNTLVFDFLMKDIKESTQNHYILFRSNNNEHVQEILHRIIHEYFLGTSLIDYVINMYIPILITELVANVTYQTSETIQSKNNALLVKVLNEIEISYATLSLSGLAEKVGYNKNYLGNKIKEETSFTFTELLNQEKMKRVSFYLKNTQLTIEQVMGLVGYENKTYFYKLFKQYYGCTPFQYRQ